VAAAAAAVRGPPSSPIDDERQWQIDDEWWRLYVAADLGLSNEDLDPSGDGSTLSGSGCRSPPSPLRRRGSRLERSSDFTPHLLPSDDGSSGPSGIFFLFSKNGTFHQPVEANKRYVNFVSADKKYLFFIELLPDRRYLFFIELLLSVKADGS
jgi:hypothetical protein